MDLVENDMDTLYEEIEHLVSYLVGNNMNTLHEERIHLVGFSFVRVYDQRRIRFYLAQINFTTVFLKNNFMNNFLNKAELF